MSSLLCGEFDSSLGDETAHYSAHGVVVRFVVLGSCEHVTRAQGARVRSERVEWILRLGFVCEGSVSVVIPSCFVSCRLCVCIMRGVHVPSVSTSKIRPGKPGGGKSAPGNPVGVDGVDGTKPVP